MSQHKGKKRVVITEEKVKAQPTVSRFQKSSGDQTSSKDLVFGMNNYKWMLIGVAFIAIGLLLMTGGHMPSNDVWDESIIYSFRRITLAPIFIIIGLILQVFAIFRK